MEDRWSWLGRWSSVDLTERPERFLEYLDAFHAENSGTALREVMSRSLDLRPGRHILEVGCGAGHMVAALAPGIAPSGKAVGLDRSGFLIEQARARTGDCVDYHVGDVGALEFADDSFDACYAYRLFQHLEQPGVALREMARVVRPGGRVLVWEPVWRAWVVDTGQPALMRAILDSLCAAVVNPDAAQKLPLLFSDQGLRPVSTLALSALEQGRPSHSSWTALEMACERARDTGAVTPEEAAAWLEEQELRRQSGRFFSFQFSLLAVGVVPPDA